MGLEGIVSKRTDAPYRSGPSKTWLKSKNPASEAVRREREMRLKCGVGFRQLRTCRRTRPVPRALASTLLYLTRTRCGGPWDAPPSRGHPPRGVWSRRSPGGRRDDGRGLFKRKARASGPGLATTMGRPVDQAAADL